MFAGNVTLKLNEFRIPESIPNFQFQVLSTKAVTFQTNCVYNIRNNLQLHVDAVYNVVAWNENEKLNRKYNLNGKEENVLIRNEKI